MQLKLLCLIASAAVCYAQDSPPATTSPLIDPSTNTPIFIPGVSSQPSVTAPTDTAPPTTPTTPAPDTPPPATPPAAPAPPTTNNSFLPPPPVLPPPSTPPPASDALPPPPVLPTNNATTNPAAPDNSTVKSQGLILTSDALLDPDVEALVRAVRQVFVRANRTSFNMSDAKGGSKAGVNANTNTDASGRPISAKRFSFSVDNNFLSTNQVKMDLNTNRLEQSLNITYLRPLADRLNKSGLFSRPLTIVPDAHNNIVTAAEFSRLAGVGVTIEELRDIGTRNYIAYTQMNFICLSRQTKVINGVSEEVVFIRTSAKEWTMTRADIAKLVAAKTNKPEADKAVFDATKYNPHIAVAWTGSGSGWTDDEIGAVDQKCFAEIALVDPKAKKSTRVVLAPSANNDMPVQPIWSASLSKKPDVVDDEDDSAAQWFTKSTGIALVDDALMDDSPRARGSSHRKTH